MTTLKQVAERAGVSSATVSKVLSNTPYVSAETRHRVLEAIEELGYVPNLAARALAHGRTFNIGVIFPLTDPSLFSDPSMMLIMSGIERVLTAHGYNMLISTPLMPVAESEQFQRVLRSRYFDGVILLENLPDHQMNGYITEHGYPLIAIGYLASGAGQNTVRIDDYNGAYAAARHLLDLGHRHFGIINIAPDPFYNICERLRGYRDALATAGLRLDAMPRAAGDYTVASGEAAMMQFLKLSPRPTAILSTTDLMAIGAINAAQNAGLRVPEDISIIGFDDVPLAEHMTPPLTTIRQSAEELGATAATLLFELLTKKQTALAMRVLPTSLIIRGSTGPVSS